ncbi:hypothetical protein HAZT_HAZT005839 [Hyalella azteca]|uniref:La-related protein 6-like n=1 Tax=Hyalella azteca TaxID=294128 RepID=A0A6A0H7J5_HYAAZ|nr:la-related protein 6-like [Hyalella azteca]KAA0201172.1 hypothetical protein HAZT_HAZT005839 [Hyalella azteca]
MADETEEDYICDLISTCSTTDEDSIDTPPVPKILIESITTIRTGFTEPPIENKMKGVELDEPRSLDNDCNSQSSSTCDSADFSAMREVRRRSGKYTNKETLQRVSELVEYYLSNDNLVNDMFLLKHVTKHKEGYVSLKLLANYKKLKRLRKDWTVLVEAIRDSPNLQMNADCTKVKRRIKLPCELEEDTRLFRSVLGYDISESHAAMDKLAEIFSKFGDVDSIQLHKPGVRSFPEILLAEKEHPGIAAKLCCLVVFEKVHCTRLALKHLANNPDLKVMAVPRRKASSDGKLEISCMPREYESAYFSASDLEDPGSPFLFRSQTPHFGVNHRNDASNWRSRCMSPCSSTASPQSSRRGPASICSLRDDRSSSRLSSPLTKNRCMPLHTRKLIAVHPMQTPPDSPVPMRRLGHLFQTASAPNSPWSRRKILVRNDTNTSSENNWPASPRENIPSNVLRLPKGPDNTKGFHAGFRTAAVVA